MPYTPEPWRRPQFQPLEPTATPNYIYRVAMVGMDQLPVRRPDPYNCCGPHQETQYCWADFCACKDSSTTAPTLCMLGHPTK